MNHPDPDFLSRYLDGDLGLPVQLELERHFKCCPVCSGEIEQLRRVDVAVASLADRSVIMPVATDSRIRDSVERRRRLAPLFALSKMMPAAVGSSIAALLVLVSVNRGLMYPNGNFQPPQAAHAQANPALVKQATPLRNARRASALLGTGAGPARPSASRGVNRLKLN